MITDRFPITGAGAYLRSSNGQTDLALTTQGPFRCGPRLPHRVFDIESIDLRLAAPDLLVLMGRQPQPLIQVRTRKEVFPGLFVDPFARRVHTIGGADDFRRGSSQGFKVMEVEGRSTLVTNSAGPSSWTSPLFHFDASIKIGAIAWELAISQETPDETISYSILLTTWSQHPQAPTSVPSQLPIVTNTTARGVRAVPNIAVDAVALQVTVTASAGREIQLLERHSISSSELPLGVPFLQAIHVMQVQENALTFYSLSELNSGSREFTLYGAGNGPLATALVRLNYRAALAGSEEIEVLIDSAAFSSGEARVLGSLIDRPPITHR